MGVHVQVVERWILALLTELNERPFKQLPGNRREAFEQLAKVGTYEGLAFIERRSLLVEHEQLSRDQRKQTRLVKQARLKLQATVQELDYQSSRNLGRSQVANLVQGEWLRRGQNLLITGPCGSGKTYLACALGYQACLQGRSTRYYRLRVCCWS